MEKLRVFIVEDELILGLFVSRILERLGAEIVGSAASGETAIPLIQRAKPDLALLDIRLSGSLTGLDVARTVLESPKGLVAFMTAYDLSQLPGLPEDQRVLALLSKPVTEPDLARLLEAAAHAVLAGLPTS